MLQRFKYISLILLLVCFSHLLFSETKERAFVNAISSAALTYTIARGCSSSSISECGCSSHPEEPPDGDFRWGGCPDNVHWGSKFSNRFINSRPRSDEKTNKKNNTLSHKRKRVSDKDSGVGKMNYFDDLSDRIRSHNSDVGRRVCEIMSLHRRKQ